MKNACLVLHVAIALIFRASLSTCSAKTQCYFDRQVGCFDTLRNLHHEPGNHDETSCAFKCRDRSIAAIRNGDCFCAASDHRDLLVEASDKCSDRAFAITCNSEDRKLPHNLCPDYTRSYCNSSYSIDDRIVALLSHMTLQDKIDTMAQKSVAGSYTDGTPLVARSYRWWNEALHGVEPHHDPPNMTCGRVCPTQFAEANALSQSWNRSLWRKTASVISTQVRAHYNEHVMEGLTVYAPQINLASNPLWGRNMETPGEDPYLTSMYAIDFVNGLQGSKNTLKTIATPKHFVGHFFEGEGSDPWGNGTQVTRYENDTSYSLQDLEQYYLPPFRAALRHAGSVMCAYQSVNGVPMCGNGFLLNRVLREEWKWHGFVVSDCDAIDSMRVGFHGYSLTGEMAVRDGIRAGCDSNCGSVYSDFGKSALEMNLVAHVQVDTSVKRLLRALFRLGLFDPPEEDPYGHLGWQHVNTDKQKALSLEGARQSIVLLQNGANVLPLARNQNILVAGPMYNATVDLLGNYYGPACDGGGGGCLMSPSQWIAKLNGNDGAISLLGGIPKGCSKDERAIPWVVRQAELVDVIILSLGGTCREREGDDRGFLHLPGSQLALFKAVAEIGKPIVVFIIGGGTYSIDTLKANDKIAILQAGFPGPHGGRAIAEIIFGDVNPSGKLTATIYPSAYATLRPMAGTPWMDSRIRPNDQGEGRSHMFYTGTPVFPFGFGLSYTTFALSWPRAPPLPLVIDLDHVDTQLPKLQFEVQLTNTGAVTGKEIVQAYWSPPSEVDSQLKKQLFAFKGAVLNPGMSTNFHFDMPTDASSIASVNESGDRVFYPGTYTITLSRGHGETLQVPVVIHGSAVKHLSFFPSPWVEGHAVTVEACVEGMSDVVRHTEPFLLAYKQWRWVTVQQDQGWIQHAASGMCLQHANDDLQNVSLQKCVENKRSQVWTHLDARISPVEADWLCLTTVASDSSQLRTDVYLGIDCTSPSSGWVQLPDGLLRSYVVSLPDQHLDAEEGLCLAARSEGRYNIGP